jgi:hypothetical protein
MSITQRIHRASDALFSLLSAEIDRSVISARQAGNRLTLRLVGLAFAFYGMLGVGGAIVLALLPHIGLVWSLLVVSLGVIAIGASTCAMAARAWKDRRTTVEAEARVEAARQALSVALDPQADGTPPGAAHANADPLRDRMEELVTNPRVLTGAAFAALSILGPGRLLRAATKGAGAASALAALAAAVKSAKSKA